MMKKTILIADHDFESIDPQRELIVRRAPNVELIVNMEQWDEDRLIEKARNVDAILVGYSRITPSVIGALNRCVVIGRYGTGTDNVDLEAATAAGIVVTNVPDYCVDEVAEHTLALLLALQRKVCICDRAVKAGEWDLDVARPMRRVRGQTLGIVGMGAIGRAVATRAWGFGLRLLAYDPYVEQADNQYPPVEFVDLDGLLRKSDIVTLHAPLNENTREMINDDTLSRMKPAAWLINVARGGLVDTPALERALVNGRLSGAALDVFPEEPPRSDLTILQMENVIVTPHVGFLSKESEREIELRPVQDVIAALHGEVPASVVNADVLQSPKLRLHSSRPDGENRRGSE